MSGTFSTLSSSATTVGGVVCPPQMTRAELRALRDSSGLSTQCPYIISFTLGRFLSGTTITLRAVSANELSQSVELNSLYDNEAWGAQYNLDTNLLMAVTDNIGNTVKSTIAGVVASFDWGNANYTNNFIEGDFALTIGATRSVSNNNFARDSYVNLTGWVSGSLTSSNIGGTLTLTGATANVSMLTSDYGSTVNLTNYTAGGSTVFRTQVLGASSINLSNTTVVCQIQNCTLDAGSSISATTTTVAGATMNLSQVVMSSVASINHNSAQSPLTITASAVTGNGAAVTHTSGTLTVLGCNIKSSGLLTWNAGSGTIGAATLNYVTVEDGAYIQQLGSGTLSITHSSFSKGAYFRADTGSSGTTSITYSTFNETARAVVGAGSTGGSTFTLLNCSLSGGSTDILKSGTGALVIDYCQVDSGGRILQSSTCARNTTIATTNCRANGTINLNSTIAGGSPDSIYRTSVVNAGNITLSANGAAANTIDAVNVSGTTGDLNITGTSSGTSVTRCTIDNANIVSDNNTAIIDIQDTSVMSSAVLNITGCTARQDIYGCAIFGTGNFRIVDKTVAGAHESHTISSEGTFTLSGGSVDSRANNIAGLGSHLLQSLGGSTINVFIRLPGTLTTNGFNATNVVFMANTSKTLTANNTSRAEYLGLTSTLPLI